ncbi:DUF6327 family protein [Zeaxanthinibacter enoshimensis]|uniref:Uncharacterized protein n=1 Tax=Zeaxanthinibacter enoshimensis TaxID=392009 RepID=A0A4R6TNY5_9FLAO|nr:DUF6327 family protein [Zeaxanthinibacter enoshimensis]TDQ31061.1 hypothetical protein CLV82_1762 [Zeaxanthinibacter enoshimensis]
MRRSYSSLVEIDEDLRILRLKREIHVENIKFNLNRTRSNFLPALRSDAMKVLKTMALTYAIKRIATKLRSSSTDSQENRLEG